MQSLSHWGCRVRSHGKRFLLTAIPTGFFGVLLGLNYGVRSQATGSMLTLSYLVSVITLTGAIFLTSQMK
jgi:malonate transporter and related proteins